MKMVFEGFSMNLQVGKCIRGTLWAVLLLATVTGCKGGETAAPQPAAAQKKAPKLTVGIQTSPAMALVMVAKDAGYFERAGLDVEIKEFTAGKFALQAFLGGSLDLAISGEVPVALSTLQGNKFRVIGQVVEKTINEVRVVAKREPRLETAEAYFGAKKRKLATSFGGGPEFFTYNFLKKHGIKADSVELVSQKPEDMPAALLSGSVDAISIFDPFARIAERNLGDKGITFADADIYSELYVIDAMQTTVDSRRADLLSFLRALHEAESFIVQKPDEAKAIVIKYTKLERAIVDEIWPGFVFKAVLNQLFLDYTTAQAKWAIEKGDYPATTPIPDYAAVAEPGLLREISPALVQFNSTP